MNLVNIFVILITTFYCTYATSDRISEIKCREYSRISTSVGSKSQPHLVWLRITTENEILVGVLGTLISDKFVLTSAVSNLIVHRSQVYFTPDEQYNIVERYSNPFYGDTAHIDIALLKLERPVVLDSSHRPACLWANKNFESTTAELVKWNTAKWTDEFVVKTLNIMIGQECIELHSEQNDSLICMIPIDAEDNHYTATPGSPIQIYKPNAELPNNYYIYGIISFFYDDSDPYINVGTKTYEHLNWIESYVWPVCVHILNVIFELFYKNTFLYMSHRDSACGKLDDNFRPSNSSSTVAGEFPWHVPIFQLVEMGYRKYKCDGILLNELTILTAASCVSDPLVIKSPSLLVALLGLHDLGMMTNDAEVINRIILKHNVSDENDLAILKLQSMVSFSKYVQPICLTPNELLFDDHVGVLPGWGQMDFDLNANILSKGFLLIRDKNEFYFKASYQNETSACSGRLGGGLVIKVDERWYLKGVLTNSSLSTGNIRCDPSALVTLTNAVQWYEWIQENIV